MTTQEFLSDKRVLVTGGSGMLGSAFLRHILPLASHVRTTRHINNEVGADVEQVQADLLNEDACKSAVTGMDVVIHAAAETGGSKRVTVAGREMFSRSLIMNTLVLDQAARAAVTHYLFLSNSSVYSASDQVLTEDDAWGETSHGMPENETGMVKRVGETQCNLYARTGDMKVAVMRAANVYGPFDNFDLEASHVIPALIHKAVSRQTPFKVWGDGSTVRDFIFVDDVAAAGMDLLRLAAPGEVQPINVGTGINVTVRDVVGIVLEESGYRDAEVEWNVAAPPASPAKRLNLDRMAALGIRPKTPLREGLRMTIDWFRDRYK